MKAIKIDGSCSNVYFWMILSMMIVEGDKDSNQLFVIKREILCQIIQFFESNILEGGFFFIVLGIT